MAIGHARVSHESLDASIAPGNGSAVEETAAQIVGELHLSRKVQLGCGLKLRSNIELSQEVQGLMAASLICK